MGRIFKAIRFTHLLTQKQNYKNIVLKKYKKLPTYILLKTSGPHHKPIFKVTVKTPNSKKVTATGLSKKEAQQNAAKKLIEDLKNMNWEDEGYLLNEKFRENAVIISAFTKNYGKITGIIYGGTSRKIKNYLQIGNKIFVIHNSKNRNKIGYLKTEIIEAISPRYFNDKKKSYLFYQ